MKKRNLFGFSLIEMLVVIGILALLSVFIVQSFISTIRTNTKAEIMRDLKQNGDYALSFFTRKIQNATSIDCSSAPSSITIQDPDYPGVVGKTFSSGAHPITGGTCGMIYDGDFLTSENVQLLGACGSAVTFNCEDLYGKTAQVSISFTLQQKNTPQPNAKYEQASMIFKTTVQMRNVYR
jgi:prepilin-type N-terminal cleavage/methylation domain-containing protein